MKLPRRKFLYVEQVLLHFRARDIGFRASFKARYVELS